MKNLLLLLMVFTTITAIAQPIAQRSTGTNTLLDQRLIVGKNLFLPRYLDTAAANLEKGIDTSGAIIFTYTSNKIWARGSNPKKWVEVGTGSGGGGGLTFVDKTYGLNGDGTALTPLNVDTTSANGLVSKSRLNNNINTLNAAIATKQNTLTAGSNITIAGNVISASGGGGGGALPITGTDADTISYALATNQLKFNRSHLWFENRKFFAGTSNIPAIQFGTAAKGYEEQITIGSDLSRYGELWKLYPFGYDGNINANGVDYWKSAIGSTKYDVLYPRDNVFIPWEYGDQATTDRPYMGQRLEGSYYGEFEPHLLIAKPTTSPNEVRVQTYNIPMSTGWGHKQERFREWSVWTKEPTEDINTALNLGAGRLQTRSTYFDMYPHLDNVNLSSFNIELGLDQISFGANAKASGVSPERLAFGFNKAIRIRPTRFFFDEATLEIINKNGNNRGLFVLNESNQPVMATNGRQRVGFGQSEYPGATVHIKKGVSDAALLSTVIIEDLPTFADDTAAGAGGLSQHMLYKTATGVLMIKL
jgi:hypothetical protein